MSGVLILRCKVCHQPFENLAVPTMNATGDKVALKCGCKGLRFRNFKWLVNYGLWPPIQPQRLPDKCQKCGAERKLKPDSQGGDGRVTILRCGSKGDIECDAIYHLDNLTGNLTLMNPD